MAFIIIGIILVLASLLLLLATWAGLIFLAFGVFVIVYGVLYRKRKAEEEAAAAERASYQRLVLDVAGTYYHLDDIRTLKEDGEYVVKYEELVPEPENEADPNAIAVYITGEKVGYVPREKTQAVREIMDRIVQIQGFIDDQDDGVEITLDIKYK